MSIVKPKTLNSRIQNKHDIEAHWSNAENFKPLAGEIIVYDPDDNHRLPRIKIGDGVHYVNQLEFVDVDLVAAINGKADTEHGIHVSFSTANPVMDGAAAVGTADTVARSDHKHPSDTTKVSHEELAAHAATASHITDAERTAWNDTKTEIAGVSTTYETKSDANAKLAEAKKYADDKFDAINVPDTYTKSEIDTAIEAVDAKIAEKVDASTVDSRINTHNTATTAHNDIRLLVTGLANRLDALVDTDDTTLDQLSEIVKYIKDNRELIAGVTTDKVNVADIIDNLTTNVANKPLSAAQGVALKALIDALQDDVDDHAHNYAGSSSAGGAATSADKLNSNAGSATNPVYFENGVPVKTTYTLEKSVPADAEFTDTVYTHPSYTAHNSGLYKVTVDGTGHVSNAVAVTKVDITSLGIPAQDTTYGTGTSTVSGLTKLYGTSGTNTDGTMTQAAINTALAGKETAGAAEKVLTDANAYTDEKVIGMISCGTADPSAAITSQFYFKYTTD